MITDAQILEFVDAFAGEESTLLTPMPEWWKDLSAEQQDQVMERAGRVTAGRLQAAIDRCNDKE